VAPLFKTYPSIRTSFFPPIFPPLPPFRFASSSSCTKNIIYSSTESCLDVFSFFFQVSQRTHFLLFPFSFLPPKSKFLRWYVLCLYKCVYMFMNESWLEVAFLNVTVFCSFSFSIIDILRKERDFFFLSSPSASFKNVI